MTSADPLRRLGRRSHQDAARRLLAKARPRLLFFIPPRSPNAKAANVIAVPSFYRLAVVVPPASPHVIADQCPRPLYTLDGGARELTTWMRRVVTPSDFRGRRRRSRRGNAQNLFALRGASMVGGRNGLPRRPMSRHDKRFEIRKQKAEINSGDGGRVVDGDEPADATDMVGAEVIRDRMPSLPQLRTGSDVRGRNPTARGALGFRKQTSR